jgi:putative transcriptional regulator
MAKFVLDPRHPPTLSPEAKARLDAMTPEEIEANALADADNPPLSASELVRMSAARLAKTARAEAGLSQVGFAAAYHISVGRLRDLEHGRFKQPDSALLAYLTLIKSDPGAVRRALEAQKP